MLVGDAEPQQLLDGTERAQVDVTRLLRGIERQVIDEHDRDGVQRARDAFAEPERAEIDAEVTAGGERRRQRAETARGSRPSSVVETAYWSCNAREVVPKCLGQLHSCARPACAPLAPTIALHPAGSKTATASSEMR